MRQMLVTHEPRKEQAGPFSHIPQRPSVPSNAEQFILHDFVEHTFRPSRWLPGKFAIGPDVFHCPGCNTHYEPPAHDARVKCEECKLIMEVHGNSIMVWG